MSYHCEQVCWRSTLGSFDPMVSGQRASGLVRWSGYKETHSMIWFGIIFYRRRSRLSLQTELNLLKVLMSQKEKLKNDIQEGRKTRQQGGREGRQEGRRKGRNKRESLSGDEARHSNKVLRIKHSPKYSGRFLQDDWIFQQRMTSCSHFGIIKNSLSTDSQGTQLFEFC